MLACALLAAAAILGTQPWSKAQKSGRFLELSIETSRAGIVQAFYDVGSDFTEEDSSSVPIGANERATIRFELPYGRILHLRLDPLDIECRASVTGARVVGPSGRVIRTFTASDFEPRFQIASIVAKGGEAVITCERGATDPSVNLRMDEPIDIGRPPLAARFLAILGLSLATALAVSYLWSHLGLAHRAGAAWNKACRSPGRTAAFVALISTIAANYPVVFSGKSFVSPGLGVPMLYGQSPWLPGAVSADMGNPNRSDVAATIWHHLPLSKLERKALFVDGELPLWNRYDSGGVPLLGQGQSCFGDPLQIIPVLADGSAWSWDIKFLLAKWLFSLGIGLCVWRSFRHLPTSLLLTASSSFIGFFVYRINHPAIFSLSYAPWILYCWIRAVDAGTARSSILWLGALIGANWCEMNSGTAKEAYALLFSMNFAGLCVLLAGNRTARAKLGLFGAAVGAGVIFAMISAPIWYTFYRALRIAYTSYNAPLAFQIQPGMLVGLFDEAFYRPFQEQSGVVNPSMNFLVLAGLLWSVTRMRTLLANRKALALLVSAVPVLALVFGVVPPGLVAAVPFLGNILHVDNAFSCALVIILSVLSGYGLKDAVQTLGTKEGRGQALFVLGLLIALFAFYFGTAQSVVRTAYENDTWGRVISVDSFIYGYALSLVAGVGLL
ncbi:MAG TPA: hypothetical protein VFE25_06820, partial [Opitutaceae bacterium]|nr:hypothetical protein [Opitutaceae bacterium]